MDKAPTSNYRLYYRNESLISVAIIPLQGTNQRYVTMALTVILMSVLSAKNVNIVLNLLQVSDNVFKAEYLYTRVQNSWFKNTIVLVLETLLTLPVDVL